MTIAFQSMNKLSLLVTDTQDLHKVMSAYPLATVITSLGDSLEISYVPVVAEISADGKIKISGHLSTRNPQWAHLKRGARMTMIFNGPQTYINSSWYVKNDVSTWNYITVQASGVASLIETYDGLVNILKITTDLTNKLYKDQWDFYIPEDLRSESELTELIGGFQLEPANLSGRFKLSQSKSLEDQQRIIKGLSSRQDENSRCIAQAMQENIKQ